jgi:hypothetical protein
MLFRWNTDTATFDMAVKGLREPVETEMIVQTLIQEFDTVELEGYPNYEVRYVPPDYNDPRPSDVKR